MLRFRYYMEVRSVSLGAECLVNKWMMIPYKIHNIYSPYPFFTLSVYIYDVNWDCISINIINKNVAATASLSARFSFF